MAVDKVELVATFEEFAGIPNDKCMTAYFGDYSLWHEKGESDGFDESVYNERFNEALHFLGLSEEEYFNNRDFVQRGKIKEAFNRRVYEIYKEDWYKEHNITEEDISKLHDEWEADVTFEGYTGSFEDYELEHGYNDGEVYACFDEFMQNEFEEFKPLLYKAPIVGEIVFHQTHEVLQYTDFERFKEKIFEELDYNTDISVFVAPSVDKSWIYDNVCGIGIREVGTKDFESISKREAVEKVVYDWLNGFRESGLVAVTNLDIESSEYKDIVGLVEELCSDVFPDLYEEVFGSSCGALDLIFREKDDPDGFNLYYYNPDSSAGGLIEQCPFDKDDAAKMIDNEDYLGVLAPYPHYLSDVNTEHFFNTIFELIELKESGLYLGNGVNEACRAIVCENKNGIPAEEIYKHQCEISNLRHELEGALMYDPDKADDIEKILDRRMCELDALLSGRPLDEVIADAKVASEKQDCDSKEIFVRENVID